MLPYTVMLSQVAAICETSRVKMHKYRCTRCPRLIFNHQASTKYTAYTARRSFYHNMATRGPLKLGLEIEAVFVPKDLKQPLGIAQFADYLAEGYSGTPGLHSNYTPGSYNGPQYVEWEIIRDVSLRKDLTNMTRESISNNGFKDDACG